MDTMHKGDDDDDDNNNTIIVIMHRYSDKTRSCCQLFSVTVI